MESQQTNTNFSVCLQTTDCNKTVEGICHNQLSIPDTASSDLRERSWGHGKHSQTGSRSPVLPGSKTRQQPGMGEGGESIYFLIK